MDAGWSPSLIATTLFQAIRVRGVFAQQLIVRSRARCKAVEDSVISGRKVSAIETRTCRYFQRASACGRNGDIEQRLIDAPFKSDDDHLRYSWTYVNSGDNECDFYAFQSLGLRLSQMGIAFDVASSKNINFIFHKAQDLIADKKASNDTSAETKSLGQLYQETNKTLKKYKRLALEPVGRSTHLMVRFLGQLVRAQLILPASKQWMPAIFLARDDEAPTPLFVVKRGQTSDFHPAVSVEIDGEIYSIPQPDRGEKNSHVSLELFTFTRIRLDQAYAQTTFPPSNTLIIR